MVRIVRTFLLAFAVPAAAQAQVPPIQTQETNEAGVVAELTECRRSEGVLSIKVRLRNTGPAPVQVTAIRDRAYDHYYVVAGGKKYFVLRDTEKEPLATVADNSGSVYANLDKGGSFTWWAKYPAPPSEIKKVDYVTPLGAPFEDVPVSER
jgi:hypothetical protein